MFLTLGRSLEGAPELENSWPGCSFCSCWLDPGLWYESYLDGPNTLIWIPYLCLNSMLWSLYVNHRISGKEKSHLANNVALSPSPHGNTWDWVVNINEVACRCRGIKNHSAKSIYTKGQEAYIYIYICIYTHICKIMYFPRMLLIHEPSFNNMWFGISLGKALIFQYNFTMGWL